MSDAPKYPHNALEGFANGCLLDLRVRFAMQLLTYSPRYRLIRSTDSFAIDGIGLPEMVVKDALAIATELFAEAERRGLVDPLPSDGDLPPELRAQAKRTAAFSVLQQMEGQKFAQRESDAVIPAAPGAIVKPRNH